MKTMKHISSLYLLSLIFAIFALPGCAHYSYRDIPAGTVKELSSSVVSQEDVSVPTLPADPPPSMDYQVGPGDVLLINVPGRTEFSVAIQNTGNKVTGNRVDGSGNIHVPYLGAVQVRGLTLTQIEQKLNPLLKKYLQDPSVTVEILEYKSLPLYLIGQFKVAGTFYMDRPMTLTQALSMGGGFDVSANLTGARLSRGGKIIPVDLNDLLLNGDMRQNVWLKGGDTIFIPDNKNAQVFVFGAVKKGGVVPFPPGGMNLAQAIASADIRDTGYDLHHIRIIRSLSTTRGQLIVVDYDKILRGEALPFPLMNGDVVYVPKSAYGDWNDALADVLPSLQLISSILQPFVSVKYLMR
ncbi:polysaccharide biosynthesis/export family protein [Geomonas sp.]|uniref:polysaccharide biosynthesis/export family protein n=1 Tax=Geomonas sp. TaxID=2651584 RepID=UPI002B46E705|nr:polysaccharide biosynthesis/export family protein [Geomonas sp.]HJV36598.1 polysaccharide biosynthesis/export family protein [Geomonas sp.]